MRPDEHRRKKNESYKKKHNIQLQQQGKQQQGSQVGKATKKVKSKPDLGTNSDRYDQDSSEGYQPVGRDFRDLLSASNPASSGSLEIRQSDELPQSADDLSIDVTSIEKAISCFSMHQLLMLGQSPITANSAVVDPSEDYLTDYMCDVIDSVYIADHNVSQTKSADEIYLMNTGQYLNATVIQTPKESRGDMRKEMRSNEEIDAREKSICNRLSTSNKAHMTGSTADNGSEDEEDLEDWLDSVLDD